MIITDAGSTLRFVTQSDHAHFAAGLLALCRFPELLAHPRREELIRATREHDNGWQETDAAPRVEAGKPVSFLTLADRERRALWSRGVQRHHEAEPVTTALIACHALALHRDRAGNRAWDSWLAEIAELLTEALERRPLTRSEVEEDYEYLRFADLCSLAVCNRETAPVSVLGVRIQALDDGLCLDPLPLAGATSFDVPCRYLHRRDYADDLDLGSTLAAARWETFRVRVGASPR